MKNSIDLNKVLEAYEKTIKNIDRRIVICAGTGCIANGAMKVFETLKTEIAAKGLKVTVELDYEKHEHSDVFISKSGCQGFCQVGPLVTIFPEEILYTKVKAEDVHEIVEKTLIGKEKIERLLYKDPTRGNVCSGQKEIPFYTQQARTVLKTCGMINPEDVKEYIGQGGYKAAEKALKMTSEEVCKTVLDSGLRGRGGGGFPTGRKWELTRVQVRDQKYVICNGDEGDPGAFMDRSVMEGNPHAVIEGMIIAGHAIGATEGYVYVRAEYPLAVQRVKRAVEDATRVGVLGDNILGSKNSFRLHVMEGAGAFVCGEETALIASIEGGRGMPRPKPPFPAQSGLWGKPTVINNVETLAMVPLVLSNGAETFRKVGTEKSPGTKTFALTGHVANTGLIEVPFGTTLKKIVMDIGGGVTENDGTISSRGFKAVQIGGPSGGCLTKDHLDLKMDFDSLTSIGAMVGSGGLVVMNQDTCMIQVAKFFMQFTQNESCGKCVLCREGTKQMLHLLDTIIEGTATLETLDLLQELGESVKKGSLCGLGKTAPNPVLSTLKYFRKEYEEHVVDKRCSAGQCQALKKLVIVADKCKGCTLCKRKCPVNAITGELKQPHSIDQEKCIKCNACIESCKFNAIIEGA